MKYFTILFAFLLVACGSTKEMISSKTPITVEEKAPVASINFAKEENVAKTLKYLASDDLEGRDSGSKGIEKAAVFLENILKENGVKPYFKTYRDTLSNFDKPAYNIVGYIEGNDAKLKNEFVIIGAHYDHIGRIKAVNNDDIGNAANV